MVKLIGFEKAQGLGEFLAQIGAFSDFRRDLPQHLLDVLRKQRADVSIESIELLAEPKFNLGGRRDEHVETHVKVQTFSVPLDLRVTLSVGSQLFMLECCLVLKREWVGSELTTTSDLCITIQPEIV